MWQVTQQSQYGAPLSLIPSVASSVLPLGDQILTPIIRAYPYLANRAQQHEVGDLGQIEN